MTRGRPGAMGSPQSKFKGIQQRRIPSSQTKVGDLPKENGSTPSHGQGKLTINPGFLLQAGDFLGKENVGVGWSNHVGCLFCGLMFCHWGWHTLRSFQAVHASTQDKLKRPTGGHAVTDGDPGEISSWHPNSSLHPNWNMMEQFVICKEDMCFNLPSIKI